MDAEPIHGGRADTGERAVGLYLVVDTPQSDVADAPHRPRMLAVSTRLARFSTRAQRWESIATTVPVAPVVTNRVVSDE